MLWVNFFSSAGKDTNFFFYPQVFWPKINKKSSVFAKKCLFIRLFRWFCREMN